MKNSWQWTLGMNGHVTLGFELGREAVSKFKGQ